MPIGQPVPSSLPQSAGEILRRVTGAATLAAGGLLYGDGDATLATLAHPGTAGEILLSATGANRPVWSGSGLTYAGGVLTTSGTIVANGGQITIQGSASPFFVLSDGTRASYVEQVSGHLRLTPPADREVHLIGGTAPGTPGATEVRFGAGQIKAGAGITCTTVSVGANQVVGAQGASVADATDAASVITQLNALLARCRAHGLIAT